MAKGPEQIKLTVEQRLALEQRIQNPTELDSSDIKIILNILHYYTLMMDCLSSAKSSIKKLKKLLGFKSERRSRKKDQDQDQDKNSNKDGASDGNGLDSSAEDADKGDETDKDNASSSQTNESNQNDSSSVDADDGTDHNKKNNRDPKQNHGRYGAQDYPGCPVVEVPFADPTLQEGLCSTCLHTYQTRAKIIAKEPRVVVMFESQPLVAGTRYALQRARCSVCGQYFTAPLPDEIADQVAPDSRSNKHYDASCVTSLVIHHYYGGVPFKRLETLQRAQGVPLADATQFDLIQKAFETVFKPVVMALRACAAEGQLFYFDDTPQRILEQIQLNKLIDKKQAIHATALISQCGDHHIILFETNTSVAGESFQSLLSERSCDDDFISMSDASSHNFPGPKSVTEVNENLMAHWVITLCLVHGRRNFIDCLKGLHDEEASFVLDVIAQIYDNDRHCKQNNLDDGARLSYHQQHSAARMEALRIWLNNLMLYNQIEPNSPMGQAIRYLLSRWYFLTQFSRVPGAPLDNNFCEQVIKIVIRYRKVSLFYRTFYGATIGDGLMSLLHTAMLCGANIFDYLNQLQSHSERVIDNPSEWLPWNYQKTIQEKQAQAEPVACNEPINNPNEYADRRDHQDRQLVNGSPG